MSADRAVVERVMAETGVDTTIEVASSGEWLRDVVVAWVQGLIGSIGERFPSLPPRIAVLLGWGVIALVAVAVLVLIVQALAPLRGRARARAAVAMPPRKAEAAPARTPAEWRADAERHVAEGHVDVALEAAWWWFATTLVAGPVAPTWTTREILARAAPRGARPLGGRLDVFIYGARRPDVAGVRTLLADMARELAR